MPKLISTRPNGKQHKFNATLGVLENLAKDQARTGEYVSVKLYSKSIKGFKEFVTHSN